jgi:diguanylate cyclase (GGDEF)-like protein/PAS domain S-box-containing protein
MTTVMAAFANLTAKTFPHTFENDWITRDGDRRHIAWSNTAILDERGDVTHVILTGIDMTERREAEAGRREAEARFRQAFVNASIGMCLVDLTGRFLQVNPALCAMLDYTEADLVGATVMRVTHPDDVEKSVAAIEACRSGQISTHADEKRYVRSDGAVVWARLATSIVRGDAGEALYLVSTIEDVTARRAAVEALTHQALHDSLTGLPNRALLLDRLRLSQARLARTPSVNAVLFIDLDGFKSINDGLGHDVGDQVLVKIAARLRQAVRPSDTVARLGGDEFVVLCEGLNDPQSADEISTRLERAVSKPLNIAQDDIAVTASIGIALVESAEATPDEMIRDADMAMYSAKSRGKNRTEYFDVTLRSRTDDRLRIEGALRQALRDDEFRLHFQPIVELSTGNVVSVEALVRLQDAEGELLPPDNFINVAEDSGLIVPIGNWVLRESCRELSHWLSVGAVSGAVHTSVNLSVRQATRPDLVHMVTRALADAHLHPTSLALELTESVLMEVDSTTLRSLEELRELGVQLGIDDFGTGYSSLTYLKRLPVSFVKVDRSFVAGVVDDKSDREIVTAVVRLGQALGLTTIAEGVENAEQLDALREIGCDQAQGYYLGRPVPEAPVTSMSSDWVPVQR